MRIQIGHKVKKDSGKPFKSGQKINTVKGFEPHNTLPNTLCCTFEEDESQVEYRRLLLVPDCTHCKHYGAQEMVRFGFCEYPVPEAYQNPRNSQDPYHGVVGVSDGDMALKCPFYEEKP